MKPRILIIIFCTIAGFFGIITVSVYINTIIGLISMFGLFSHPNFEKMEWKEMKVSYWLRIGEGLNYRKNIRTFTISGDKLNELKSQLNVKKASFHPGTKGDQIIITTGNGEIWQGVIVFEDTLALCLLKNTHSAYTITLTNHNFYDLLLGLCVENEKTFTPQARKEHIMLRRNLGIENHERIDIIPNGQAHSSLPRSDSTQ